MAPPLPTRRKQASARAMVAALVILGVLAGLVSYLVTLDSDEANGPASGTRTTVTANPDTPLASMYDIADGQCINQLPYRTSLNASSMSTIPCDDSAARLKLLFKTSLDGDESCSLNGKAFYQHDDQLYCLQALVKISFCYPAWIGTTADGRFARTVFYLPHACGEAIDVTEDDLPVPTDWPPDTQTVRADIKVNDIIPNGSDRACPEMGFEFGDSGEVVVCAEKV